MEPNALTAELIELTTACHTGTANDDQRARLERLLEDNADARAIYLRLADDVVTLNDVRLARQLTEQADAESVAAPVSDAPTVRFRRPFAKRVAAAAIAASLLTAAAWIWRDSISAPGRQSPAPGDGAPFARIVSMSNVVWRKGDPSYKEWDRIGRGNSLQFDVGNIEVLYDNGVQFVLQGPADCTFLDEKNVMARSGKLVARVSPEAIGFKIVTPHAAVIDRGTSFGMTIDPDRQTDVVVYEGMVDLSLGNSSPGGDRRLGAGEAMRIGRDGHLGRISSVGSDAFLPPPRLLEATGSAGRLITSVADNLTPSDTAKYYRVVNNGFREDCQAFVDRLHQWNGIDDRGMPPFLERADYVMTFNDDKVSADLRIALTVAQPARLYVLFDDRAPRPKWLTESFVDTGWDVGIDEGYNDVDVNTAVGSGLSIENVCSVWAKDVSMPSTVLLGSLREVKTDSHPREVELAMYGIAATPLPSPAERPRNDQR